MHDGAIIIRNAVVGGVIGFLEVVLIVRPNVVPVDPQILIPIEATLFMMETDGVTQFMQGYLHKV